VCLKYTIEYQSNLTPFNHFSRVWLNITDSRHIGVGRGVGGCERPPLEKNLWNWQWNSAHHNFFLNWPWKSGIFDKTTPPPSANPGYAYGTPCIESTSLDMNLEVPIQTFRPFHSVLIQYPDEFNYNPENDRLFILVLMSIVGLNGTMQCKHSQDNIGTRSYVGLRELSANKGEL
jgi:hypothetical protein